MIRQNVLVIALILLTLTSMLAGYPAYANSVTLTPSSGLVGTVVTVKASDPTKGTHHRGICSIQGSPVTFVGCSETKSGAITGSFIVSNVLPGAYQISITATSGQTLFAVFTVTSTAPKITLKPTSGPSGTVVTVSGSGFAPGDAGTFTYCSSLLSPNSAIISSSASCTFTTKGALLAFSFTVGSVMPGPYVIQVMGDPVGDVGQAVFTVTSPTILLVPSSGPPTALVTVSGSGFSTGDQGTCTILQTSTTSPNNVVTNPTCNVSSEGELIGSYFTVGQVAAGTYVITVQGNTGDSASATFTVTGFHPKIKLKPSSGPAGTVVLVTGSGFNPADYCNSGSFSSSPLGLMTATSCSMANGQIISASFTIRNGLKPGTYTVILTASTLDSAQATFTVT